MDCLKPNEDGWWLQIFVDSSISTKVPWFVRGRWAYQYEPVSQNMVHIDKLCSDKIIWKRMKEHNA